MIARDYICDCGYEKEDSLPYKVYPTCPVCGNLMSWKPVCNGIRPGDGEPYWCRELGVGPAQRMEYMKTHPDAQFREDGAILVKNYQHQKTLLKETGMHELDTPSRRKMNKTNVRKYL